MSFICETKSRSERDIWWCFKHDFLRSLSTKGNKWEETRVAHVAFPVTRIFRSSSTQLNTRGKRDIWYCKHFFMVSGWREDEWQTWHLIVLLLVLRNGTNRTRVANVTFDIPIPSSWDATTMTNNLALRFHVPHLIDRFLSPLDDQPP